jgi:chaperonin GroEL
VDTLLKRRAGHRGEVVFPPRSRQAMLRGVDAVVSAIRPTLGPLPRAVAVTPPAGTPRPIELLDDGGLIARRIIALPDRDEDAGAMLVRHVVWRVRERAGDGAATAAVLFGTVFAGGLRAIAAGVDPSRLRSGLERGLLLIVAEIEGSASRVEGEEALRQVAASLCGDDELAAVLGEVFATVGADGEVEVRPAYGRGVEQEYVEGAFWEGGLLAREMSRRDASGRVLLRDAALALTDLEIDSAEDLLSFLDRTRGGGIQSLVIVARRFTDRALGALLAAAPSAISRNGSGPPHATDKGGLHVIAVRTPGATPEEQFVALEDLALLCGGRPIVAAAGQTLAAVDPAQLGRVRRAWATTRHFGISGGAGDQTHVPARVEELRRASVRAASVEERATLQRRMGKLLARTAVVSVGGSTEREGKARRERARRTVIALREALRGGVVPGGGVALLACRQILAQERDASDDRDERAALTILLSAMEAPFRTIVANAGYEPERMLHVVNQAPPGYGFDATRGEAAAMVPAGIVDAASVQRAVVEMAVSAAAQACTIGALVHSRRRAESVLP